LHYQKKNLHPFYVVIDTVTAGPESPDEIFSIFLGLVPAAAWGKIPLERHPNNNIVEVAHTFPVTDAFPASARKWDRTSDRISRGNIADDGCVNCSVADPGSGAFF
jgi:hypothetical protein